MRRIRNHLRHHRQWWRYYGYKYLTRQAAPHTFRLRSGRRVTVPRRLLPTYKECFFDDSYLKGFPAAARPRQAQAILDIGANVGYFSLFARHCFPEAQVYSYEPVPRNFDLLQQYQQGDAQWHCFQQAVSGSPGSLTLHHDASDSFTTAASIHASHGQSDTIEVPATTLPTILATHGLDRVDLLKLDCEGAEYSILYHTPPELLRRIQRLAIETHLGPGPDQTLTALSQYLEQHAFTLRHSGDLLWAWRTTP